MQSRDFFYKITSQNTCGIINYFTKYVWMFYCCMFRLIYVFTYREYKYKVI